MADSNEKIIAFKTQKAWATWLAKNHAEVNGIWLRFYKKDSGIQSVTYDEALDDALCYGWIDGHVKSYDQDSWIRKFTPRRSKSIWSKRNIEHVERLTKEGRMKAAGLKEMETAKADGRLEKAYDAPASMKIPDDFLKALSKNKKALAFFNSLNKANTYAIGWRLQTAKKPETREKRMKEILAMMAKGEKFH